MEIILITQALSGGNHVWFTKRPDAAQRCRDSYSDLRLDLVPGDATAIVSKVILKLTVEAS